MDPEQRKQLEVLEAARFERALLEQKKTQQRFVEPSPPDYQYNNFDMNRSRSRSIEDLNNISWDRNHFLLPTHQQIPSQSFRQHDFLPNHSNFEQDLLIKGDHNSNLNDMNDRSFGLERNIFPHFSSNSLSNGRFDAENVSVSEDSMWERAKKPIAPASVDSVNHSSILIKNPTLLTRSLQQQQVPSVPEHTNKSYASLFASVVNNETQNDESNSQKNHSDGNKAAVPIITSENVEIRDSSSTKKMLFDPKSNKMVEFDGSKPPISEKPKASRVGRKRDDSEKEDVNEAIQDKDTSSSRKLLLNRTTRKDEVEVETILEDVKPSKSMTATDKKRSKKVTKSETTPVIRQRSIRTRGLLFRYNDNKEVEQVLQENEVKFQMDSNKSNVDITSNGNNKKKNPNLVVTKKSKKGKSEFAPSLKPSTESTQMESFVNSTSAYKQYHGTSAIDHLLMDDDDINHMQLLEKTIASSLNLDEVSDIQQLAEVVDASRTVRNQTFVPGFGLQIEGLKTKGTSNSKHSKHGQNHGGKASNSMNFNSFERYSTDEMSHIGSILRTFDVDVNDSNW